MEAIQGITSAINTFVRFFESINYLFCQIRWLEQNISNSRGGLLLVVGAIVAVCLYIYYFGGDKDQASAVTAFIVDVGPVLIVVGIIGYLLYRRFTRADNLFGSQGTGNTFEDVFFGSRQRNQPQYQQVNREDREAQLPQAHVVEAYPAEPVYNTRAPAQIHMGVLSSAPPAPHGLYSRVGNV
jgi:hypothetical protein